MNTFSDPRYIIDQLPVMSGQHIADLGAGAGAYSLALAEKIGNNIDTKIFAVEIQKELLSRLEDEARSRKLSGIHVVWGDIDEHKGTRLRDTSIDTVLLINTLFQIEKKKDALTEIKRILKPKGKLVVMDWIESFGNIGPKEEHIVSRDTARLLCEEAGFIFDTDIDTGKHHYGFIVHKN